MPLVGDELCDEAVRLADMLPPTRLQSKDAQPKPMKWIVLYMYIHFIVIKSTTDDNHKTPAKI